VKTPEPIEAGVSHLIGRYADAVRIPAGYDTVLVSGTPGLAHNGSVPDDITDESTQAWKNVETILAKAGARLSDIVSVRQWLTSAEDIPAYTAVRSAFLGHEPASMLAVVPALVRPRIRLEIEVTAAVGPANSGR
jgi:2-iminobutanoate/2-iminopropanoate deaminase